MAQNFKTNPPPVSPLDLQVLETSIRQLLLNGNSKVALEKAKQLHKAEPTAAYESLLLEAYRVRIQSLLDQNLVPEAKSLVSLVGERFPNANTLLKDVGQVASARTGDLAALLQPLNDPELSAERRAEIERIVQAEISDLRALAECPALPPEHSLRQAAAAIDKAFDAATSGPVSEEQITLPEVSHRSPLAPWKLLVRAIACLHRGEDQQCRDCLAAIKPESVPARLVPAMLAILGVNAHATSLKPPERSLISRISVNLSEVRSAFERVELAFNEDSDGQLFKAMHAAVRECQRAAPELLPTVKQIIHVRGASARLDPKRLISALEGEPRKDAAYFRMFSRALEMLADGDPLDLIEACEMWDKFREHAVREGLFTHHSVEMAQLYLHMARTLSAIPAGHLGEMQRFGLPGVKEPLSDLHYYLFPDKLFARACVIDPHPEAFSQWLSWAKDQSESLAESVAKEWHRISPADIEPLLYLIREYEKRNAFPSALSYLEKAERIDPLHSVVRTARLRLLAGAAIRHLQQKKAHLAMEKLADMAKLPQLQQGDRPAFLAALRGLTFVAARDEDGANRFIQETHGLLGSLTTTLLLFGIAATAKRLDLTSAPDTQSIKKAGLQETIPASMARVMAMAKDFGISKFSLPMTFIDETEKQFSRAAHALDLTQISALGELGLASDHPKLAWAASTVGLKRGGPTQASFLLLRARALPEDFDDRRMALAAAAAELARFHRDDRVVDQAVDILRDSFDSDSFSLTYEQACEIARREADLPSLPRHYDSGPDYSDIFPETLCQCPKCRYNRGETESLLDDEEDEEFLEEEDGPEISETEMRTIFDRARPKDLPPELADTLFQIMKEAFQTGESPEEIFSRLNSGGGGSAKQKKGRNRNKR